MEDQGKLMENIWKWWSFFESKKPPEALGRRDSSFWTSKTMKE